VSRAFLGITAVEIANSKISFQIVANVILNSIMTIQIGNIQLFGPTGMDLSQQG
jgi:hypothetical protein